MLTVLKGMLLVCAMLSMTACATITRGKNDVLQVQSNPSNAQVRLSDGQSCEGTPCAFQVPRKAELNVAISKQGCEPRQVRVTNRIADNGGAAMAGNVLFGGIIGAGVDASTGAMRDLVPNPVQVNLDC